MNRLFALGLVSCFALSACGSDDEASVSLNIEIHGPDDGPDSDTIGFPRSVDACVDSLRFSSYQGLRLVAQTQVAWNATPVLLPRVAYGSDAWISVEGLASGNCDGELSGVAAGTVLASGATPRFAFEEGGALPDVANMFTGLPERFQPAFRFDTAAEGGGQSESLLFELRNTERAGHTITELDDGSGWLVIGGAKMGDGPGISNSGITSLVDTIEFYDTFRGDFLVIYDDVCTAGAPVECALRLPEGVAFHTATALEDGRVLIVGGLKLSGGDALLPTSSAYVLELTGYAEGNLTQVNYESDVFPSDRAFHTATRMADGRVVIIGGIGRTFGPEPTFQSDIYQVLPQAELVIGDSGADLNNVRGLHTATFFQRHAHGIIVVGGRNANGVVGTSEVVYAVSSGFDDPLGVDVFASGNSANDLSVPRFGHSAVSYSCPFTDEEFLAVVGGFTEATGTFVEGASPTPTVEVYRPDQFDATQLYTWSTTTAQLANEGRAFGAAVGLPISGDLIFAGGLDASGAPSRAADRVYVEDWGQCDVLGPARQIVGGMGTARAFFALAPLDSGFLLATGGFNGAASVESTEFFNPNDYALVADNLQ